MARIDSALDRESSGKRRRSLLLAAAALLLVLAACLPAATPSPSPTAPTPGADGSGPVQGTPPPLSRPVAVPEETRPVPMESPAKGSGDTRGQAATGIAVAPSGSSGGGVAPGARPIVDQTFQWVGVIVASDLEGRHLELKRECDGWVLLAESDALVRKLEENVGNKVIIWGRVFTGASIYMRQAISVQNAFGPKDPMPMTLVAIPEYPCPGTPTPKPLPPVQPIILSSGEIAARGNLVWEQGKPYLSTPAGRIVLVLPPVGADGRPPLQPAPSDTTPAAGATATAASLDVVAVGKWRLDANGLELSAHTVRPWPTSVVTTGTTSCGDMVSSAVSIEPMGMGEIAARGALVWDAGVPKLKTQYGPIGITFAALQPVPPSLSGEALIIGKWTASGGQLNVSARQLQMLDQPCPPPAPDPGPSLMPGEIAAVGTLVWEGSQPYLDTPSGRILLAIPPDMAIPSPTATSRPGGSSPVAQLLVVVVGKWSIKNGQLAIAVRYLRPWPTPTDSTKPPVPIEPAPPPETTPPPGTRNATIYGRVRIGPLCPVEPCPNPPTDVYSSRALMLQSEKGNAIQVKLGPDGSFKAAVDPGTYTVTLTDCSFLGCRNALPKKVTVAPGQALQVDIDIDTGIR